MTIMSRHSDSEHICSALFRKTLHDKRAWMFADYDNEKSSNESIINDAFIENSENNAYMCNETTGAAFVQSVVELTRAVHIATARHKNSNRNSNSQMTTRSVSSTSARSTRICVVCGPPSLNWLRIVLASLAAGCVIAPLNNRYSREELRNALLLLKSKKDENQRVCGSDNNEICMLVTDSDGLEKWMATGEQLPGIVIQLSKKQSSNNSTISNNNNSNVAGYRTSEQRCVRRVQDYIQKHQNKPVDSNIVEVYDSVASFSRKYKQIDDDYNNHNDCVHQFNNAERELLFNDTKQKSAFIVFTSGTTSGKLKAAILSHSAFIDQSIAKLKHVQYEESDIYLNSAPLHHVGGLSSMLASLMIGSRQMFIEEPRFVASHVLQCCLKNRITSIIAVPAMLYDLSALIVSVRQTHGQHDINSDSANREHHCQSENSLSCSSVTKVLIGGGGLTTKTLLAARQVFPNAMITAAYGMTETASSITFTSAAEWELKQRQSQSMTNQVQRGQCGNYVGRPARHFELTVINLEDGEEKAAHNSGEICVRGSSVMTRYLNESLSSTFYTISDQKGWFRTGDIGLLHADGTLSILGRKKDVIRVGSENVHASEVERILLEAKGIDSVAVVGLPDERLGEIVSALITLQKGWHWNADEQDHAKGRSTYKSNDVDSTLREHSFWTPSSLKKYCRAMGLSGIKVPRIIAQAPNNILPRTSLGKVKKPQVKALLLQTSVTELRSRL